MASYNFYQSVRCLHNHTLPPCDNPTPLPSITPSRRELLTADDLEHLMRSVEGDDDEDDEMYELPYARANKKAVAVGALTNTTCVVI